MQGTLQRESVEYNSALSGMANQLTLLNILRAKEDLPIYYTTISRVTGEAIVVASGGFNAQLKTASPTNTTSETNAITTNSANTLTNVGGNSASTTNAAATTASTTLANTTGVASNTGPSSSIANTTSSTSGSTLTSMTGTSSSVTNAASTMATRAITDVGTSAITSGGNIFAPSLTGQLTSGPAFDINILDTQQFYNGVLQEIPFSIVDNYIDQNYDNQLLIRLLVDRFEFVLKSPVPGYNHTAGKVVKILRNVASGTDEDGSNLAAHFAYQVACLELEGLSEPAEPKPLAPLSRVTLDGDGKAVALKIQELADFDGQKLDIDRAISTDSALDKNVLIVRPGSSKRSPHIVLKKTCAKPVSISQSPKEEELRDADPKDPPSYWLYKRPGYLTILDDTQRKDVDVPVDVRVVFRSPEGVIKFVGQYLTAAETDPDNTYKFRLAPLFSVSEGHSFRAVVGAEVLGKHYFIGDDANRRRNMIILGLIEQLVNLQKTAAERPTVLPVQVVP